jgi:hypothetical protein
MENKYRADNSLSINRFKDMNIDELSDADNEDYTLAILMKKVLQTLEISIPTDRVFNRARQELFTSFWEARDRFTARRATKDTADE